MQPVPPVVIVPSGMACGAEVGGVTLSEPLSRATFDAIAAAFVEHGMLVFRDQILAEARNGPRKLDSALSEIFLRFQATNLTLA